MQLEVRVHSRHLGCAVRSVRRVALPAMATSAPASLGTPCRGMDTPAWPMVSTVTPYHVFWDGSENGGSFYVLQWCSQDTVNVKPGHTVFVKNICANCSYNYGVCCPSVPQLGYICH